MRTMVVYDSFFGNTEQIAQAVARILGPLGEIEIYKANSVGPEKLTGVDLLVIGSPTRGFRPTEAVAALLRQMKSSPIQGVRVAAFDTRLKADEVDSKWLKLLLNTGGYAAGRIAEQLQKAGGTLIADPAGFYVADRQGPLNAGEVERAEAWASQIAAAYRDGVAPESRNTPAA